MSIHQERMNWLQSELQPYRHELVQHSIYTEIQTLEELKTFMENHVFAVWDFMSLLKSLQRHLTCVEVPWVPTGNPATRRLINEIVLEEETDVDPQGNPLSHFELYLQAMQECGANAGMMQEFLNGLSQGKAINTQLEKLPIAPNTIEFVKHTFETIQSGQSHRIAAAFTFGREDVIPDMFRRLISDLNQRYPGTLDIFQYYLDRHVHLDEEVHSPLAMQMVSELCGEDDEKWAECREEAIACYKMRIHLWDGILAQFKR